MAAVCFVGPDGFVRPHVGAAQEEYEKTGDPTSDKCIVDIPTADGSFEFDLSFPLYVDDGARMASEGEG
eukprot:1224165-Pyramimonas_sp.AAC.1